MTLPARTPPSARWAVTLLIAFVCLTPQDAPARLRTETLWLVTSSGEHPIEVEIAEDEREKALGLMYRSELKPGAGMLFPYESAQELTMWMKNTYIPLDMVFIRKDGVVHRIHQNAEPQSEAIISSQGPVTAVLEIKGGEAGRLGLKPGDRVRHRRFGTK